MTVNLDFEPSSDDLLFEAPHSGRADSFTRGPAAHLAIVHFPRLRFAVWVTAAILADLFGGVMLSFLVFGTYAEPHNYDRSQLWAGVGGFVLTWGLASHSQALYRRETMFGERRVLLLRAMATCALAFGLIMLLAFGLKWISGISRFWSLAWAASAFLWVIAARVAFKHRLLGALRHGYCLDRALVLAGTLQTGYRAGDAVEGQSHGQIRIAAVTLIPGLPGARSFETIDAAIRDGLIDRIFIAGFDDVVPETNAVLARLTQFAVDVTLLPNFQGLRAPLLRVARIGMLPTVDVAAKPMSAVQSLIKRTEDLVLAGVAFFLAFPVLLLIALAIRLDSPGPIFFRQTRLGFHDQSFRVWKFRTMYHDSDRGGPLRQTSRNDDRVTRVGRVLRRTSLDELPQLINVLRGEMSMVGPRPHAMTMTTAGRPLHAVLQGYAARHRIKPGITGLAQVNGCRGEVDSEDKLRERVLLDCRYIENWSIALDAWILLRTIVLVAFDRNAY